MNRRLYEFFCNDCDGWIMLTLNTNHSGNFGIKCPNCGRIHPRCFKKNEIQMPNSEVRVVGKKQPMSITREGYDTKEVIVPMNSAYSKKSRLDKLEKDRGVMAELWARRAYEDGYEFTGERKVECSTGSERKRRRK